MLAVHISNINVQLIQLFVDIFEFYCIILFYTKKWTHNLC